MTNYQTFTLNGVDYSDCINQRAFLAELEPVNPSTRYTFSGTEHYSCAGYRYKLTFTPNPKDEARALQLLAALHASGAAYVTVGFKAPLTMAQVTRLMRLDARSIELLGRTSAKNYYSFPGMVFYAKSVEA